MSKKEVATAIGTTPETLSRVLQRLQQAKVLDWTGDTVQMFKNHLPDSGAAI